MSIWISVRGANGGHGRQAASVAIAKNTPHAPEHCVNNSVPVKLRLLSTLINLTDTLQNFCKLLSGTYTRALALPFCPGLAPNAARRSWLMEHETSTHPIGSASQYHAQIQPYNHFPWRATASSSMSWEMPFGKAVSHLREDGTGWHVVHHLSPTAVFL